MVRMLGSEVRDSYRVVARGRRHDMPPESYRQCVGSGKVIDCTFSQYSCLPPIPVFSYQLDEREHTNPLYFKNLQAVLPPSERLEGFGGHS